MSAHIIACSNSSIVSDIFSKSGTSIYLTQNAYTRRCVIAIVNSVEQHKREGQNPSKFFFKEHQIISDPY